MMPNGAANGSQPISLTDKCRGLYRRTNVVQSGKWICKWFRRQPLLRDSAYMFSKSRFFLALILLGPWVRASGGAPPEGVNPYWTLCTEATQIIGLLNSRKFHVYRPTNDVDFADLELRQRRGEKAAISSDQFVLSPEPVEFSGEREWSLVVGGVGHLLADNYETLLKCVNSATKTAAEWRPRGDLLQLARFQNDLLMTVHALERYTNAAAESPQRRSKTMRAGVLIKALDDLLAKCLLTEDEISRLPDTGDLGVVSADQRSDDDLIYVGLRGVPTQHEEINLHCIYNETRVLYPKTNQTAFSKERVLEFIRKSAENRGNADIPDCTFLLLDRLIILDNDRKPHRSKVTVHVRLEKFENGAVYGQKTTQAVYDLFRLERSALSSKWQAAVVRANSKEKGGLFSNLPNIPGEGNVFFEAPLRYSCYRCHQNRLGFGLANYAPNPRQEPTRVGPDFVIEH